MASATSQQIGLRRSVVRAIERWQRARAADPTRARIAGTRKRTAAESRLNVIDERRKRHGCRAKVAYRQSNGARNGFRCVIDACRSKALF